MYAYEPNLLAQAFMTHYDVYIGKLAEGADPLDWGGDWSGNVPTRESPFFPPRGAGSEAPFFQLISRITDGRLPGKQVDWGGWLRRLRKQKS